MKKEEELGKEVGLYGSDHTEEFGGVRVAHGRNAAGAAKQASTSEPLESGAYFPLLGRRHDVDVFEVVDGPDGSTYEVIVGLVDSLCVC